ncbi:MAG: histidine triad nucleotide-binding protein [Candidatus Sumerlaeota bacterium]|nr:histidine triad nucleotide-binding protein [Candidatus Sumerlaeota bacterium]
MSQPDANCLFCKIIAGKIPSAKVYEDDRYFAFRDINPQAPMHVLIVPKAHIPTLNDLKEADTDMIGGMFLVAARLARKEGCAEDGYRALFNCNAGAGQSVFHVHLHVLGGRLLSWPPG